MKAFDRQFPCVADMQTVARHRLPGFMRDYLGARFVDMYSIVKRVEQDRYFSEVPRLDYDWYLRNA